MRQRLAALNELSGYKGTLPIPYSFPVEKKLREVSYDFFLTGMESMEITSERWTG